MRHTKWASLAVASALIAAWTASPGARPRYGGHLTVEMSAAIRVLDPTTWLGDPAELAAGAALVPLVFDTLLDVDDGGRLRPRMAVSWESDASGSRWLFTLRPDVTLHDGSSLTARQVATRIKNAFPEWELRASSNRLEIRTGRPAPDLPFELARPQMAVAVAGADGALVGSGPFKVDRIEPGRTIELRAHERYHAGRPYLDRVTVRLGRTLPDQLIDLELERADLVSVTPQEARRLGAIGMTVIATRPLELVAIARDRSADAGRVARAVRALTLAVDREAVATVLLAGQADPATTLLPEWLSGYARSLGAPRDITAARAAASALGPPDRVVALQYDGNDPDAQSVAERVAADGREAGLEVRLARWTRGPRPATDLRLVRLPLEPASPDRALAAVWEALDVGPRLPDGTELAPLWPGASFDEVARAELQRLDSGLVAALAHQRSLYGLARRVRSWSGPVISPASGRWNLADTWLAPEAR